MVFWLWLFFLIFLDSWICVCGHVSLKKRELYTFKDTSSAFTYYKWGVVVGQNCHTFPPQWSPACVLVCVRLTCTRMDLCSRRFRHRRRTQKLFLPACGGWFLRLVEKLSIVRDRTHSYPKLAPTRADIDLLIWESIMTRCVSGASISEHRSARHKLVPTQRFQFASALNGLSLHFATNSAKFCLGVGEVLRWVSVRYQVPLAEIALSRRAALKTTDLC